MARTELLEPAQTAPAAHVPDPIQMAERVCQKRNARFTFIRRAVFEVLHDAAQPLSAYQIKDRLGQMQGKQLSPITVYRALDFLLKHKLVARLESRNAFVLEADPSHERAGVFFICMQCGSAAELGNSRIAGLLRRDASALGFEIGRQVVELQGTCASCRGEDRRHASMADQAL